MKSARLKALWALTRGLLAAVAATLAGMLLLAAAVIYLDVTDGALAALNQLLKLLSVVLGARLAVGVGGERGFVTGAAVGFVYMVLGYSVYWAFHGSVSAPLVMLGEMLLGAVLGALSGAVVANLRPKKRRKAA